MGSFLTFIFISFKVKLRTNIIQQKMSKTIPDLIRLKRYRSSEKPQYSYMTKFEIAGMIGTRSEQISMDPSCPPVVELNDETESLEIAKKELTSFKIPNVLCRKFPNGKSEYWIIDENQDEYKDIE